MTLFPAPARLLFTASLCAMIFFASVTGSASRQAPRDDVIAAVQTFFDAMSKRDVELAKKVVLPDARFYSASERDGQPVVRPSTGEQFINGLATGTSKQLERMWNPDVKIQGAIATLWTRYDFHSNGTFSHCGVDAFNLVKMPDGWKIAAAMWTIERTGCPESPLGPPK